jgi:hypothetical protein
MPIGPTNRENPAPVIKRRPGIDTGGAVDSGTGTLPGGGQPQGGEPKPPEALPPRWTPPVDTRKHPDGIPEGGTAPPSSEPLPLPPVPPPPPASTPPSPAMNRSAGIPAAQPRGTFGQPGTPAAAPFARGGPGRVFSRPVAGTPAAGALPRFGAGSPFASEGGPGGPNVDDDLLMLIMEQLGGRGF